MKASRSVWLFTLGNEVVQGRVVNTNASYLGRRLTLLGFEVWGNISLVDDVSLVTEFLKYVMNRKPALIVTTGGLGPTYDDRTLEAVAKAAGLKLVLNEEALKMVREKYSEKGFELTEDRVKMAYLPEGGIPIPNSVGTAPGCWLEVSGTVIVSLPGVPRELEAMWENWVEPRLRKLLPEIHVEEYMFRVIGVPESSVAPIVKRILKIYDNVYIKTHPKGHEIKAPILDVYVMAVSGNSEEARRTVNEVVARLTSELKGLGGHVEDSLTRNKAE